MLDSMVKLPPEPPCPSVLDNARRKPFSRRGKFKQVPSVTRDNVGTGRECFRGKLQDSDSDSDDEFDLMTELTGVRVLQREVETQRACQQFKATVIRDGVKTTVLSEDLVCGDVVLSHKVNDFLHAFSPNKLSRTSAYEKISEASWKDAAKAVCQAVQGDGNRSANGKSGSCFAKSERASNFWRGNRSHCSNLSSAKSEDDLGNFELDMDMDAMCEHNPEGLHRTSQPRLEDASQRYLSGSEPRLEDVHLVCKSSKSTGASNSNSGDARRMQAGCQEQRVVAGPASLHRAMGMWGQLPCSKSRDEVQPVEEPAPDRSTLSKLVSIVQRVPLFSQANKRLGLRLMPRN